jgi:hypothetical protein
MIAVRALAGCLLLATACEADTRGLELQQPPTPPRPPPGECTQAQPEITTGTLQVLSNYPATTMLELTDGIVYVARTANVTGVPNVVAFEPGSGREEPVTAYDVESYLIDAHDDTMLVASGLDGLYGVYHARRGRTPTLVIELERSGIFTGISLDQYAGRETDLVDRDGLIWRHGSGFSRWDAERGLELLESYTLVEPTMRRGRIVWVSYRDNRTQIIMHEAGTGSSIIAEGDVAWPALGTGSVFFIRSGALMRFEIDSGGTTQLHPGPCGPPHAEGDRAVAACGPALGNLPPGETVVYYDSVQTHELFAGGYNFAPRISLGRIAWIRYRSPEVMCAWNGEMPAGEIRFLDLDLGGEPLILGEVGAPCLCCDAWWPAPVLELEGEVAAWNYAPAEDPRSSIGWARIERREVCPP